VSEETQALQRIVAQHEGQPWDADEGLPLEDVWATPPGLLVAGILSTSAAPQHVLEYLAVAVAKRVLACWELYCDGDAPRQAVVAVEQHLLTRDMVVPEVFEEAAEPAFRGTPIVDCRACDTGSAASAASHLVRFIRGRDPAQVVHCLAAASAAWDQSPLYHEDRFMQWLRDIAIPGAVAGRLLSPDEENAYRQFTLERIHAAREEHGGHGR